MSDIGKPQPNGAPARPGAATEEKQSVLPPGSVLGGFEIQTELGKGGMAIVYRGVQLSLMRPVAIKVLAPRFARNPNFITRFEREAGALATLSHANIVQIIDKGHADETYYFVMELVEGQTLDQLLHSIDFTPDHYKRIISSLSSALTYIHSKGIIHRDIKPANILLTPSGTVKLSDFGIAHLTRENIEQKTGRKATVGTVSYMSPEQINDPTRVDVRSDIFSLAVTFHKMFTKQLPDPTRKPTILNPKLPRSVDEVLERALRNNPDDRYPTVSEFCQTLRQCFSTSTNRGQTGQDDISMNSALSFGLNIGRGSLSSLPRRPETGTNDSEISSLRFGSIPTPSPLPSRDSNNTPRPPGFPSTFGTPTPGSDPGKSPSSGDTSQKSIKVPQVQQRMQVAATKKRSIAVVIAFVIILSVVGAGLGMVLYYLSETN